MSEASAVYSVSSILPLQQLSQEVYDKKYRLTDKTGAIIDQTSEDTFKRVAKALAAVETTDTAKKKWEKEFLWALQHGAVPAGRIMSNAGAQKHKSSTTLINCVVSQSISDSMDSILSTVKDAGISLKSGAGIGYCFSNLRPRGAYVSGVGATSSGPISFMDIYDQMCSTISSAGGRRGAQMATFHIYHPDVEEFVTAKRQNGRLRQFNVSVLITYDFIDAVNNDKDWDLYFPVLSTEDLCNSKIVWKKWHHHDEKYTVNDSGLVQCKVYRTVRARKLWNNIMKSAYEFSEPGIILVDQINRLNNAWFCEEIYCSNPCGEVPLPPHGACLLGSVNLTHFVSNPFTEDAEFDWEGYKQVVRVFTRMLDNVVEINGLPLPQQRQEIERKRRHGMGVLGLGSALAMLRIRYGHQKALEFTEQVMQEMVVEGWKVGVELAKEKGPAPVMEEEFSVAELKKSGKRVPKRFAEFQSVKGKELFTDSEYFQQVCDQLSGEKQEEFIALWDDMGKYGARFTHHTAIAPTGTIAASFGNNCSSGIEPSFSHSYVRNLTVQGKKSRQAMKTYSYEALLWKELYENEAYPEYFVEADSVYPTEHLDMQAAAQHWVDQSISKTINLPTEIPFDEFKKVYDYGIEKGLKGTTVFRYNPETLQGVLVKEDELSKTLYEFKCDDGTNMVLKGSDTVMYEGEEHNVAMLYDAIKEGRYERGY